MRIIRFPSLTEPQFSGCVSAFVDSLTGELNAASIALRRLEGKAKGSAFAHEMALDTHRYGALIVLDRWGAFLRSFGAHWQHPIAANGLDRVAAAEAILGQANQLIDASEAYSSGMVEVCALAFQSLGTTFAEERAEAERSSKLGPMLPAEYGTARGIFLEDLAAR